MVETIIFDVLYIVSSIANIFLAYYGIQALKTYMRRL
tara:strand:+ start:69 stop:179 length:111 start_codon:yes stop_codon:yes gene_type:complete